MQFAPFSHKTALNGRPSPISLVSRKNGAKPYRNYFDGCFELSLSQILRIAITLKRIGYESSVNLNQKVAILVILRERSDRRIHESKMIFWILRYTLRVSLRMTKYVSDSRINLNRSNGGGGFVFIKNFGIKLD